MPLWEYKSLLSKTLKNLTDEITWPSDLDARVVFRSADFAKHFIILSVNFKTFCIGFIMNTSTVKGDRKREIGQSPIKKKFRAATISREDIDEAIANGIKLAFKEQQSTLDSIVTSAGELLWTLCWFQHYVNWVRTYKRLTILLKSRERSLRPWLPQRCRHVILCRQLHVRTGMQSRT